MPSTSQDKAFAQEMGNYVVNVDIGNNALDAAVQWIAKNLSPDDVFSEKQLVSWAESNGYIKE